MQVNAGAAPTIPPKTLDVGDGYLEPETRRVLHYDGSGTELRVADDDELAWALQFCRSDTAENALALRPTAAAPIALDKTAITADALKK